MSNTLKTALFADKDFTTLKDCTTDDIRQLFKSEKIDVTEIDLGGVEKLSRSDFDVAVFPYLNGEFSEKALVAMEEFQTAGGSLFFIGDLPHHKRHYPYRNMESYRFGISRCCGPVFDFKGMTDEGRELLGGELKNLDYFKNRHFKGVRFSAYPPDRATAIFDHEHVNWENVCSLLINKYSRKYLGAKFAVIGSDGGEPRESVCGAYPKEWTYDPGFLDRKWKGRNDFIIRMYKQLAPRKFAGVAEFKMVHGEEEETVVTAVLRNLTDEPVTLKNVTLKRSGRTLIEEKSVKLAPRETKEFASAAEKLEFGVYDCVLEADGEILDSRRERVMPEDRATFRGFGLSTFRAFYNHKVTQDYFDFVTRFLGYGAMYLRPNIPWEDVEPEEGRYDWTIPDQIADFAKSKGIVCKFWMFPTTRGSGISDAGVPLWTLKEPAIDRFGGKGYFPTIWGDLYQTRYFAMLETFMKRYAPHPGVAQFILDYGNSDFPYGYYYYGGSNELIFDYSAAELKAYRKYLKEIVKKPLNELSKVYGKTFNSYDDIPLPYSEELAPYNYYCQFRTWTIENGFFRIGDMLDKYAPDKRPDDLPGHGLGSIADVSTATYEVRALHYDEELKHPRHLVHMHNDGRHWGGEAWQVGAAFSDYDDAIFGSLRYNAAYCSIPGPDLGVWEDDIARCGFIRRSIMGAARRRPKVAVIDSFVWNHFQSLSHMSTRFDTEVDLLTKKSRFDFSCYKLFVMAPNDVEDKKTFINRAANFYNDDPDYYRILRESVDKGLSVMLYPQTLQHGDPYGNIKLLLSALGIEDVKYSGRKKVTVKYPDSFGGGKASGMARNVELAGAEPMLTAEDGTVILAEKKIGKGSVILAGFNTEPDSLDGSLNYFKDRSNKKHTLWRLIKHLGLQDGDIDSDGLNVVKSILRRGGHEYLLVYSRIEEPVDASMKIKVDGRDLYELSDGLAYTLEDTGDGMKKLSMRIMPRKGYYFMVRKNK